MNSINFRMKQKMNEVFSVEQNELGIGFITNYFKKITSYLKNAPFILVIPLAILISLFLFRLYTLVVVLVDNHSEVS